MRTRSLIAVLTIVIGACSPGDVTSMPDPSVWLSGFSPDADVDFEPLSGPRDALAVADVLLVGTITEVSEGVSLVVSRTTSTGGAVHEVVSQWTTVVVEVEESFGETFPWPRVSVQLERPPFTPLDDVTQGGVGHRVLVMATDETEWEPYADPTQYRFEYPDEFEQPFLIPLPDGFWMNTPSGLRTPYVDAPDPGWGGATTLDDLVASLRGTP